ncbi:molecular chaperone TorD family protein [Candidatus Igneacidithiobacillus taiwanensis]|uniref:TorD/DmsD family molecular chaperone n=1 Tax=Candidatus Igneacidithiobacillus taiwanensis TaxID=1945924 RepID=UPI00289EA7C3|nr:molecular chaperone TorD family protein [Candidatus Igneacidithiobacillus taiwanensis]
MTTRTWRLVALVLAEPTEESLVVLRELSENHPTLQPALAELEALPLEVWQVEHTRLFSFPALCPPFASAYLEDGILNGHRAVDLEQFYQEYGLEAVGLPADYLGTICECAAYLEEENPEMARFFSHDALGDWLPDFSRHLGQLSELLLYRELARILDTAVLPVLRTESWCTKP